MIYGVIVTLVLGVALLCFGVWCLFQQHKIDKRDEALLNELALLKKRLEIADFMKAHGVICKEEHQLELEEIMEKLDKMEEEING